MAYSKVFFHAGAPCHGCTGIMELFQKCEAAGIPFGVYSVENGGMIADMLGFQHATLIYRTLATDVAPYHLTPVQAAAAQWVKLMDYLPTEIKANRGRVWVEVGNEQDKNVADWLGWYYVELSKLADRDGYRICGPGWSTGEPEPMHWQTPGWLAYLRLCAANPNRLGITVHEYSLDADDIMASAPWLVGRVKFLFDTCKAQGIAPPTVFVTEAGWTHNDLPHEDKAKADIAALAALYAQYPTVKAAFLWSLLGGADKKTLAAELNALIPWLADYTVAARFPDPVGPPPVEPPPPTDPPTAPVGNALKNGSFDEGWTDATTFPGQHPLGWEVVWNTGMDNPHAVWQYMVGEGVHKNAALLPPAERDVFIWDGDWTYKLFADKKAFWVRLKQALDLPAGRYRLTTPVWVDCYRWNGFKDYAVEPWQAETMVKVNQAEVKPWSLMVSGGKATPVTEFDHAGGVANLAVHFRCNWPISNNLWLDGWSLSKVTVTEPEPEPPPVEPPPDDETPYKMTVVLLPPVITEAEALTIYKQRFPAKNTIAYSWDDARALLDSPRSADTSELIAYGLTRWPDEARADIMAYNPIVQAIPAPPGNGTPPPVVDTRPVIDISHHQGTVNWDKFAPKVQAVIIRIGNGYTEDTQGRRNCAEATRRGVPFATYHYFQPGLDPTRQAEFYGKLAAELAPGRLVCVDLEEQAGFDSGTSAKARTYINALSNIVDHDPMIYTSLSYWTKLGSPIWGIEYPLWIAAWTTAARPIVPSPFGDWTLWQYAVDTISPSEWGVQSSKLDFNRFNPRWGTPADYFDDTWYDAAPPVERTVDLLPFMRGDHRRQFDMGYNGGTQTTQVWHLGPKDWLYIKGENGEYERLGLRTHNGQEWIFRFEDTSESAERFYAHYLNEGGPIGAPWLPRFVEVGKWYETSKFVQHYLKEGCVKQNGGPATDRLRVVSYPRVVNYASAQSLARLDEVITVEWSAGEQYDFAFGRGCVAFRDANRTFWFIGDLYGRADKTFKKPSCIELGW